ncbi:hypothetical protein NB496_09190 [Vibrio alginolyticus]|uniref:hypothetical protein n=1 Tax=Vibrio harveyi group TaxID=717610 RepID=UPI00215BE1E9|nr:MULTISPECIES: hypothetical protein [Vibrio harveyi group]MCR9640804.1 hypothetical protein [Vibrio alginolyticus]MCS0356358.1 hypothetical protein [Vibrio diabolicus]
MFGPVGGGLTNSGGLSSSATMGDTKSGGTASSGITLGDVNMGGLSGSNMTMIAIALVVAWAVVKR